MRQKLVVLTGAGMSAESGLKTFRDMGGLWEEHEVCEVASFSAWQKNKELVLRFYNARRSQLSRVKPNAGHYILAELEQYYDVQIITQNVDDLHELAGSKNILHLHGELTKARSTQNDSLIYDIGYKPIEVGDVCELGSQLRPHIVFGLVKRRQRLAMRRIWLSLQILWWLLVPRCRFTQQLGYWILLVLMYQSI